ncbi:BQ2448_5324 [Microbotryum intermedium]|uniref:BQ2448_5324 protein n=1 Tax=Microbotryum intermedium TaxID=269621 RepID=A0A238F6S9_9BASI|nr:BQ2448_5324 [Microbotryum intermedium]
MLSSPLALVGGIPTKSQDLPGSIIFAVAFAFLAPLAMYRVLQPSSRTMTLFRPAIFIVGRIATYCIRAVISDGHYAIGLFILLLTGFILLCEPLLNMLEAHVTRYREPSIYNKDLMDHVVRLLKLALFVAFILGIVTGASVSGVEDGTGSISSFKTERDANTIICLVVVLLVIPVSLIGQARQQLPFTATLHLIVCAALLAVGAIFKLYTYLNPGDPYSTRTKVLFYILLSTPEWLVTVLYLVFNIQEMYQLQDHARKVKEEKRMKKNAKKGQDTYDLEQGKR